MQRSRLPSRTGLHDMGLWRCAHIDRAEEFTFDVTWTHQQADEYLRHIVFPVPFGYLEIIDKGKQKDGSPRRQWVLINNGKQRYEAVAISEPAGVDLARHRGRQRCGTKDANVIIGEQKRREFLDAPYNLDDLSMNLEALRQSAPKKEFASCDPAYGEIEIFTSEGDPELEIKPIRAAHSKFLSNNSCHLNYSNSYQQSYRTETNQGDSFISP